MKKYTPKQIERSLKKLAIALARANYPFVGVNEQQQKLMLWDAWAEAFKVINKTGARTHYNGAIKYYNSLGKSKC